ncbi:MAG: exodeoxyribonuclease VII small subunit [Salinisphaeraceae bacterium]|jgi:exodeoxyribonuclease VII small subunit|nr:exodeoxyribonuclease VII small subunit [Salinisphaeraceae bacterium]
MPAKKSSQDQPDALAVFETSMSELETLVEALESGDIGLDASLKKFERGVALARQCQQALKTAELRIDQLLQDDEGQETLTPVNVEDD